MRFLTVLNVLALLFSVEAARAEPPIIWNGDFAFNLAPSGYEQNSGRQIRDCGSTVPSAGAGISAPIGSLCQYSSGALGALYIKTGGADTAWVDVLSSTSGWSLTGNAGTTAGTNFLGTTDAQDVVIKRNNVEVARAQASGWQASTVLGSSSASGTLTLRSTSDATVGSLILADQAAEKIRIGPTGSASTFNYSAHLLTTNANALTNAFVIQDNSGNVSTTITSAGPQGFIFAPKDAGGTTTMITRTSGSYAGQWYVVSGSDGALVGEMNFGQGWGIRATNTGYIAFRVSGVTGQTADLTQWHNQTAYGGTVSSVGANGNFRGPAGSVGTPGFAFQGDTNNGWYAPAADTQAWSLAGAEEMRLDSTGLGIDVTPAAKLDVNGGARIRALNSVGVVTTDADGDLATNATLPTSLGGYGTDIQEERTGTFGGVDTTYTLTQTPVSNASVVVWLGTVIQRQGTDYTIAGSTITFAAQDVSAQNIYAVYRY